MARMNVDMVVEAISQGFDKVVGDLRSTGQAAARAGDQAEKGSRGVDRSALKWTEVSSAINVAQQAFRTVMQAAETAYEIVAEGAELEIAEKRFDRLAASIGATADVLLGDMRSATNNMMSDAELMASATDIISLGLMDTQEGVVRLARVIGELGLDMNQVILTFANDSTMRLDALGLSIEDVTDRAAEFESQGIAATKAFDLGVLEALEDRLDLIGSAAGETTGDIDVLKASAENSFNAMKQAAARAVAPILKSLADMVRSSNEAEAAVGALTDIVGELGDTEPGVRATADAIEAVSQAVLAVGAHGSPFSPQSTVQTRDALQALAGELVKTTASQEDWLVVLRSSGFQADEFGVKLEGMGISWREVAAARQEALKEDMIAQYTRENAALREYNATLNQSGDITESYTKRLEEQGNMTEMEEALLLDLHDSTVLYNDVLAENTEQVEEATRAYRSTSLAIEEANARVEEAERFNRNFTSALDGANLTLDDFERQMIEAAAAAGLDREQLALLTIATGDYTEEQVQAILKQAAMIEKAEQLGQALADGKIDIDEATQSLFDFDAQLDQDYTIAYEDQSVKDGIARADELADKIAQLDGRTATVNVHVNQTGATLPSDQPGFQHGGSFTVGGSGPPDSQFVGFWATPGERVTITPQGRSMGSMGGGAGARYVLNVYNNANQEDIITDFRMMEAAGGGI